MSKFKLKTTQAKLLGLLSCVNDVIRVNSPIPVLANAYLRIEANGDAVAVGTDQEIEITAKASLGEASGSFATTVEAKKMTQILKTMEPDEVISIETDASNRMIMRGAGAKFVLATLPADDFPRISLEDNAPKEIEVKEGAFLEMLSKVSFAMAFNDIRYYLNGVNLSLEGKSMQANATDGHRLATDVLPIDVNFAEKTDVIIPGKTVQQLIRLLSKSENTLKVQLSRRFVSMQFDDVTVVSKLVEGKYPDVKRVIPQRSGSTLTAKISRTALVSATQRASIIMTEKTHTSVVLNMAAGQLTIESKNANSEVITQNLNATYGGPEVEMAFNIRLLEEGFRNMKGLDVQMDFTSAPATAALFTIPEDPNFKYIVMPMKN